jgi:hypothetical protein
MLAGLAVTPARADYPYVQPTIIRPNVYDYSASVIDDGTVQHFWWCGGNYSRTGDDIFYRTYNLSTGQWSPADATQSPVVLQRSLATNAWDYALQCNPRVVRGSFSPFGPTGAHYNTAMYYTGTSRSDGKYNRIGVAFSNDDVNWVKFGNREVIGPAVVAPGCTAPPTSPDYSNCPYGVSAIAAYNRSGTADIIIFYLDTSVADNAIFYREALDGVTFGPATRISTAGLVNGSDVMTDIALDPQTQTFYALAHYPWRPGDSEGYGYGIYKLAASSVLVGTGTWQALGFIDSNLTGLYLNLQPSFRHDAYDNISNWLPNVFTYFAGGGSNDQGGPGCNPPTSGNCIGTWEINSTAWTPSPNTVPLTRWYNCGAHDHWVTGGYVSPKGGTPPPGTCPSYYSSEGALGYMYMSPAADTSLVKPAGLYLYSCVLGSDHFVSQRADCEGQEQLGILGWIYQSARLTGGTAPIYRCYTGSDHFVSPYSNCEGAEVAGSTPELLGYIATSPS